MRRTSGSVPLPKELQRVASLLRKAARDAEARDHVARELLPCVERTLMRRRARRPAPMGLTPRVPSTR